MKILKTIGAIAFGVVLLALWFVIIRPVYTPIGDEWRPLVAFILGVGGGGFIGSLVGKIIAVIWF